jgi:hypothetical protein
MAEDFGFVPDPPKKKEKEDFGFIPDDPASQTKREYVEQGGKPEDVYSPERAKILVEQGPEALIAEPPLKRGDGSIAGPTLPTEEALAKGLIEKRAEPAVKQALADGVDTVSSGYDQEKGVGFAVGRSKDGKVVRVEKEPDNFGFVPDEPKKKAEDFGFVPDQPKRDGLQPMSEYQRPDPANDDPTFVGALGRGAIRSALPTAAGIATGAATGAAIGAVATGPFAPAGAAIGGLAFGMAAAFGAEKLQDYGLEKIVSPETKKAIDEQFAKDAEKQPVASFAGQVAPSFALFRPSPSNLAKAGSFAKQIMSGQVTKEALETPAVREQASNLLNVAFGAGTQTGLEAYGQLERGEFDPLRLGASVVIGALQTEPTRLGKATITEPMARMEEAIRVRKATPQDAQNADMAESTAQQDVATTEPQDQNALQEEQIQIKNQDVVKEQKIPSFEEFSQTKSKFSVPEKIQRETFTDDFGEIDISKAWKQVIDQRPQPIKVPRGYLESTLQFRKTSPSQVEKSNPDQFGLAEFIRSDANPAYVGIRLIDGWHRAQKAFDNNKEFYVYPVESERSSIKNAYDFAKKNEAFHPLSYVVKPQVQEAQVQPAEEVRPESMSAPRKEDVILSAGEKARLTRLDTIENDLVRLKENDPDQAPYYDERLNQITGERENILRRAESPTKALAEEIIQPDEAGYDIIDFIKDEGGILSKGKAIEQKNISLYGKKGGPSLKRATDTTPPAEYDGMPKLDGPYLKLMGGKTSVDEMAQSAFENLGIGDGTSGGLWNAVTKAIESRRKTRDYNKSLRQTETQRQAFRSALFRPKAGDISYQASNLSSGDTIRRGDVDFKVIGTDRETSGLVIDGGQKYGERVVKPDAFIFADRAFRDGEPLRGVQVRNNRKSGTPRQQEAKPVQIGLRERLKTGLDNFRRTFQDKFVDVENLQKRVGKGIEIKDFANIKQAEELYHGKVGERLTEFDESFAKPITEEVAGLGLNERIPWVAEIKKEYFDGLVDANGKPRKFVPNKDIFDLYATAKHAKERNAVIAQRFPNDPLKQDGGSGLTNNEADRLLVDGQIDYETQARLEPIRQKLLEVNRRGILNLYEGGLISRDTYDLLTERYKDYVPLIGKDTGLAEDATGEKTRSLGTGAGFDVRGSDITLAEGRNTRATDILAYSFQKYMDSVVRSEKNKVMQTAEQFAISYPDNGVIQILPKGETGNPQAPDIIAYKENGETKYLRINDPRLADVMKNRASPVLGSVIEKLGSLNRYFAFINTQASPEFVISNFARDLQTALVNINSDQAQGLARGLVKNIAPALKATYRAELGKADLGGRMDVFYRQFKAAGGRMTFFGMKDFQTLQKQIQSKLAGGGSNAGARVFRLALDKVGQLNGAVENATRLAAFATLKERGYTDQQAAYAARNITVNFTRKGTAGPLMNAFYLFFNANIQGSARIIQALATSKKAQKIVLGAMAFGFFRDMVNRIVGGEDETGVPIYDKIPEYKRRQNMIIMNPYAEEMGVQYFMFPMPYGYSVFDYAGQLVADTMPREIYGGGKRPMDSAVNLTLAAIDNFNPIGGSYSLLQAISPTITTPLVDLALNQDFSGRPIMPTPNPFDPVPPPNSQRYWNNVNPASKWITEKLNEVTGGSKARSGFIDVSPETLDYGYDFLTGAVGKFGERVMMAPIRAAKVAAGQEDVVDLIGDIPMVRKVTGSVPSFVDVKRYQDMRTEILTVDKELKLARQAGETERARDIIQDAKPELRLVNMIKATEQDLKELRSQKRKLQELDKNRTNPAIQKRLDINRERQKALMMKALKLYNSSIDEKM